MSTLLRGLRICLIALLVLAALVAAALLIDRLWVKRDGPPPAVQAALAALQPTPESAEPNAAVWLYLSPLALPNDFSDAQAREWVSKDRQYLQTREAETLARFRDLAPGDMGAFMVERTRQLPSRQAFALRPHTQDIVLRFSGHAPALASACQWPCLDLLVYLLN
jgi:hypothetical protein